jgi:hypothetical protein
MDSKIITTVSKRSINVWDNVGITDKIKQCPISGTKGLIVKKITLRGHVDENYWNIISDENFFFCPNKNCELIYFNNEKLYYFSSDDVKSRVSHKFEGEPRPICYCKNVLEHRILDEIVVNKRASSLDDIKKYTGARTGKLCHITNPSGRCCGPQVNEVIAKGLLLLENPNAEFINNILEQVHSGCEFCKFEPDVIEPSIDLVVDACKKCNIEYERPGLTTSNKTVSN